GSVPLHRAVERKQEQRIADPLSGEANSLSHRPERVDTARPGAAGMTRRATAPRPCSPFAGGRQGGRSGAPPRGKRGSDRLKGSGGRKKQAKKKGKKPPPPAPPRAGQAHRPPAWRRVWTRSTSSPSSTSGSPASRPGQRTVTR